MYASGRGASTGSVVREKGETALRRRAVSHSKAFGLPLQDGGRYSEAVK